jgi:hypothetical protein
VQFQSSSLADASEYSLEETDGEEETLSMTVSSTFSNDSKNSDSVEGKRETSLTPLPGEKMDTTKGLTSIQQHHTRTSTDGSSDGLNRSSSLSSILSSSVSSQGTSRKRVRRNTLDASLLIADARPKINAVANKFKGKGYEDISSYKNKHIALKFLGIGNIHVMRNSQKKIQTALSNGSWEESLKQAKWLHHVRLVLSASCRVAANVATGQSVLVHCSDGTCVGCWLLVVGCWLLVAGCCCQYGQLTSFSFFSHHFNFLSLFPFFFQKQVGIVHHKSRAWLS